MNTDRSFVTILDPNMSSGIHARQRHAWLRGGLLRPGKCILAVLLAWSFGGRTSAASFQALGDLPGGTFASWAHGVSADGRVAVGQGTSASGRQAFRWTEETGITDLGDLPGGGVSSDASAVSADGTVIVGGCSSSNGFEACRWTRETGMVGLGDLPGGSFSSYANAVSSDGQVIVGAGSSALSGSYYEAFRWTQATVPHDPPRAESRHLVVGNKCSRVCP